MTTFERQRRVLEVFQKQPGIRVPAVAKLLGVSEATLRNDLRTLAQAKRLVRVRGGAVVTGASRGESPAFSARAHIQSDAKHRIASRVADLIKDGDALFCDASTTVFHLAYFLRDRRNLIVITNGVEIARSLAENPSNTVILLGGVMRADGTAVAGPISERVLRDLRVKTAFLSCTGVALEDGLYEVDINEAQLKRNVVATAGSVVALIDSSKFGKVDLTPFARLDQISHLFADDQLSQEWIQNLKQACVPFTICGEIQPGRERSEREPGPRARSLAGEQSPSAGAAPELANIQRGSDPA